MKRRVSIWAIVPVTVALSFLLGRVPSEVGIYSLYSTVATVSLPQPQAVFFPKEEPLPVLATVKKQVESGPMHNQTDYTDGLEDTAVPVISQKGPQVLIVSTHTCEAYTPDEENYYVPTDNDRTEDPRFNMQRIGREAKAVFEGAGLGVLLDETVCDLPSYNGSYKKSLSVIEKRLKEFPSISVVLDLHRDAITLGDGTRVKLTADIDGKTVAQAMAVVGTDQSGQAHPNWRQNLAFANAIQKTADRLYPGLMRPINLRTGRFNQHTSTGALLYEIGTAGNTLDEALRCIRLLADAIVKTVQK